MAVESETRRQFNLKRLASRTTLGAVLLVGGGAAMYPGLNDNFNDFPRDQANFNADMDRTYPLLSQDEAKMHQDKIKAFEDRLRELTKTGQVEQIPVLINGSEVVFDYAKINENNENKAKRGKLYKESGLYSRYLGDLYGVLFGEMTFIVGLFILADKGFGILKRKLKRTNSEPSPVVPV